MSWMTPRAPLKMTGTELTRRHSVGKVTHINRWERVGGWERGGGGGEGVLVRVVRLIIVHQYM